MIGCIIAAGLLVGLETYQSFSANPVVDGLDFAILSSFTFEILLKFISKGSFPQLLFVGKERWWNFFDLAIVLSSFPYNSMTTNIKLLRMFRLMRLMKIFDRIPQMRMIIDGLMGGLKSVGYIALLMFMTFYLYSIIGIIFFSLNDPFHFGNIEKSMLTLLQTSTLDSWSDVFYINYFGCEVYPSSFYTQDPALASHLSGGIPQLCSPSPNPVPAIIYFVSFISVATFCIFSLFIGAVNINMADNMIVMKAEKESEDIRRGLEKVQKLSSDNPHQTQPSHPSYASSFSLTSLSSSISSKFSFLSTQSPIPFPSFSFSSKKEIIISPASPSSSSPSSPTSPSTSISPVLDHKALVKQTWAASSPVSSTLPSPTPYPELQSTSQPPSSSLSTNSSFYQPSSLPPPTKLSFFPLPSPSLSLVPLSSVSSPDPLDLSPTSPSPLSPISPSLDPYSHLNKKLYRSLLLVQTQLRQLTFQNLEEKEAEMNGKGLGERQPPDSLLPSRIRQMGVHNSQPSTSTSPPAPIRAIPTFEEDESVGGDEDSVSEGEDGSRSRSVSSASSVSSQSLPLTREGGLDSLSRACSPWDQDQDQDQDLINEAENPQPTPTNNLPTDPSDVPLPIIPSPRYLSPALSSSSQTSPPSLLFSASITSLSPWFFLAFERVCEVCCMIVNHRLFSSFIMLAVIVNAALVGLATDPIISANYYSSIYASTMFLQGLFILECALKILSEDYQPWRYFTDYWNLLDFAVSISSFVSMEFTFVSANIFRLFRLLRIFRLMRALPQLQRIVVALISGMTSMLFIFGFLVIFYYFYGVIGVLIFRDNDSFHFGTIGMAMVVLFEASTLDNWSGILYTCLYGCEAFPGTGICDSKYNTTEKRNLFFALSALYWTFFVIVGSLTLLSLFVGVINISMELTKGEQAEMAEIDAKIQVLKDQHKLSDHMVAMYRHSFDLFDHSGSGTIYYHELEHGLGLVSIQLNSDAFYDLYSLVDTNHNGLIDFSEYLDLMLNLKENLGVFRNPDYISPALEALRQKNKSGGMGKLKGKQSRNQLHIISALSNPHHHHHHHRHHSRHPSQPSTSNSPSQPLNSSNPSQNSKIISDSMNEIPSKDPSLSSLSSLPSLSSLSSSSPSPSLPRTIYKKPTSSTVIEGDEEDSQSQTHTSRSPPHLELETILSQRILLPLPLPTASQNHYHSPPPPCISSLSPVPSRSSSQAWSDSPPHSPLIQSQFPPRVTLDQSIETIVKAFEEEE